MTPGPWEALVLLPILLLAIAYGLRKLARFIKRLKRTIQHQPLSRPEYQNDYQIDGYTPGGWRDPEISFSEKDEVRDRG
jgi:hypothetical protein